MTKADRPANDSRRPVLPEAEGAEASRIAGILRSETVGGALLLVAAVMAMVWANSPWSDSYFRLVEYSFGPHALHLDLTMSEWAGDGLLAIFFFVAGLELKREFIAGELRDPRRAAVPVAAALGGVIVPAAVFVAVNLGAGGNLRGWAVVTATDIAFALAILAIVSSHLPTAMRTFLLTLAVVDDLVAVTIIAVVFTSDLQPLLALAALLPLAAFGLAIQRGVRSWWLLIPLAALTWGLVHASGVHATVAGVLLAFTVPVRRPVSTAAQGDVGLAEHLEHVWRPISTTVAVPVFALLAAGVGVGGLSGLQASFSDRVAVGVVTGLVVGKCAGVFGATWVTARFSRATLDDDLIWADVFGLSLLCGVGFTVSLLIAELAYGAGSARADHAKVGVLVGSLAAGLLAAVILRLRDRAYRAIAERRSRRADGPATAD